MTLTSEDIKNIEQIKDAFKRSLRVDNKLVTDYYNKLLNKNVSYTNCGQCIRTRAKMIVQEFSKLEKQLKEQQTITEQKEVEKQITPTPKPKTKRTTKK